LLLFSGVSAERGLSWDVQDQKNNNFDELPTSSSSRSSRKPSSSLNAGPGWKNIPKDKDKKKKKDHDKKKDDKKKKKKKEEPKKKDKDRLRMMRPVSLVKEWKK
jgi:hypothetical protein